MFVSQEVFDKKTRNIQTIITVELLNFLLQDTIICCNLMMQFKGLNPADVLNMKEIIAKKKKNELMYHIFWSKTIWQIDIWSAQCN
jgi:hypothetical protein